MTAFIECVHHYCSSTVLNTHTVRGGVHHNKGMSHFAESVAQFLPSNVYNVGT